MSISIENLYPKALKFDNSNKVLLVPQYAKFAENLEQLIANAQRNAYNDLENALKLEYKSPERYAKYIELFNKYIENDRAINEISTNTKQGIKWLAQNDNSCKDIDLKLIFAIAYLLYKNNVFTEDKEIYDVIDYMFKPQIVFGSDRRCLYFDTEKSKLITSVPMNTNIIGIVLKEIDKLGNLIEGSDYEMITEDFDKYLCAIIESEYILLTIASQYIYTKESSLLK